MRVLRMCKGLRAGILSPFSILRHYQQVVEGQSAPEVSGDHGKLVSGQPAVATGFCRKLN